jgi:hypothetical protein
LSKSLQNESNSQPSWTFQFRVKGC